MSNTAKKARNFAALSGGALVVASPFVSSGVAHAGTITVDSLADDGSGGTTLREAIQEANSTGGADTIVFQSGLSGTITLTGGQLAIDDDVTITGPGSGSLTVDADGASRAFLLYLYLGSFEVNISGLTITGGAPPNNGAGIYGHNVELSLDDVVLDDNDAGTGYGGGIFIGGSGSTLAITDSTISGNSASYGGAVYVYELANDSVFLISDSVISDNSSTTHAGGFYMGVNGNYDVTIERSLLSGNTTNGDGSVGEFKVRAGTEMKIIDSTVSGNTADESGALYFAAVLGDVLIENTTVSGNASLTGGGVYVNSVAGDGSFTIAHSTITGNTSTNPGEGGEGGGGVYVGGGTVTLDHTVVAGNTSTLPGADISAAGTGAFVGSYSMVGDLDGFTLGGTTNLPEGNPMLGALADNGGPTKTHLPLTGSPLINSGDPAFASPPAFDQRGEARVSGGRIDVGAVEVGAATLPPTGGSNGLMASLGAGLLALGGALHLTGRRKRSV